MNKNPSLTEQINKIKSTLVYLMLSGLFFGFTIWMSILFLQSLILKDYLGIILPAFLLVACIYEIPQTIRWTYKSLKEEWNGSLLEQCINNSKAVHELTLRYEKEIASLKKDLSKEKSRVSKK